jgi:hypothetical protein
MSLFVNMTKTIYLYESMSYAYAESLVDSPVIYAETTAMSSAEEEKGIAHSRDRPGIHSVPFCSVRQPRLVLRKRRVLPVLAKKTREPGTRN